MYKFLYTQIILNKKYDTLFLRVFKIAGENRHIIPKRNVMIATIIVVIASMLTFLFC